MFASIIKTPPVIAGWAGAPPFLAGEKAVDVEDNDNESVDVDVEED